MNFRDASYVIELLTPKQNDENFEAKLDEFALRYRKILDHGAVVSICDNPLGNLHFTAMEVVGFLGLPFDTGSDAASPQLFSPQGRFRRLPPRCAGERDQARPCGERRRRAAPPEAGAVRARPDGQDGDLRGDSEVRRKRARGLVQLRSRLQSIRAGRQRAGKAAAQAGCRRSS